jgi:hypothetical protein
MDASLTGEVEFQELLADARALEVPLNHAKLDRAFHPRWYELDLTSPKGSACMTASIEASLTELQPKALKRGKGRRVAGWVALDGNVDAAAAVKHLASCMIHRRGGRDFLLRLHDPAVLWALWTIWPIASRAALLGPVGSWHLLDPQGQHVVLSAVRPAGAVRLKLDDTQWTDVDNLAAIHGMFRQRMEALSVRGLRVELALDIAARALRRARASGIHHHDDLALFAEHALLVHPHFDRHPALQPILQVSREDSYSSAVEALGTDDWMMISKELTERAVS